MDRLIENLVLGLRWLLLPLYLALIAAVLAIYFMVGRELVHIPDNLGSRSDIDLVQILCALLDLVLLANLLVMVAISSYESFISRIAAPDDGRPEWLGKLDSSNVKVKVAVSVVMISMIQLLRLYLQGEPGPRLLWLSGVHSVFIVTALGIALIDRAQRVPGGH
jgi:uncharacterized protein (TIGR00645 family)